MLFFFQVNVSWAGVSVVDFSVDSTIEKPAPTNTLASLPGWDTVFNSGFENGCSEDSDRDGLMNCVETNTGHFVSVTNAGTSPTNPDTDGDGLIDGDEVLGTAAGLNLRSLGVSPVHKDILIEYDWFDDAIGCGAHSHRPTSQAIAAIKNVFAAALVPNPDGVNGINIIQDYGQGGSFNGGNYINDADGIIADGLSTEFLTYEAANFSASRKGYFHYVILPHAYTRNGITDGSTGIADIFGDEFIVSTYCYYNSQLDVVNDVVHELGHNLGLLHGGDDSCNYKPNYNSVMNYRYTGGVDTNCDVQGFGDGGISYSYGLNRSLNESNLNENLGVCNSPTVPIDWNGNGKLQSSVSFDINSSDSTEQFSCGGSLSVLHDYNDWGHLRLEGVTPYGSASKNTSSTVIACEPR